MLGFKSLMAITVSRHRETVSAQGKWSVDAAAGRQLMDVSNPRVPL